jgi:nitroreductase
MASARDAALHRRSNSRVTDAAPTHQELLPLLQAAARVADHSSLRPWRIIELRGAARGRLGAALVEAATAEAAAASGTEDPARKAQKLAGKPLRAPLLLAIVVVHRRSEKVPGWEQEAVASGVAHLLSLLLGEAGWGVMWRTGPQVRSAAVHRMHRLDANEQLLGWLYVGGVPPESSEGRRILIDPEEFLTELD